jgi:hypothetical protein
MTGDLDLEDFLLRQDLARLYALCGPDCVAELLIELGCRRMVRTEIEILLARYILTASPPEGSA